MKNQITVRNKSRAPQQAVGASGQTYRFAPRERKGPLSLEEIETPSFDALKTLGDLVVEDYKAPVKVKPKKVRSKKPPPEKPVEVNKGKDSGKPKTSEKEDK